jgi:hypothetical protein
MKQSTIDAIGEYVDIQINQLGDYIQVITSAMEKHIEPYEGYNAVQVPFRGHSGEAAEEFNRLFTWHDEFDYHGYLRAMLARTAFLAIHSLLEHELLTICQLIKKDRGLALGPEELKDKGIIAAQVYLKKLCGIPFPEGTAEWGEIKRYIKIRNLLAHNDGRLRGTDPAEISVYVEKESIKIDSRRQMQLSNAFCLDAIETVRRFFTELIGVLRATAAPLPASTEQEKGSQVCLNTSEAEPGAAAGRAGHSG